jgi:hypothetical protein
MAGQSARAVSANASMPVAAKSVGGDRAIIPFQQFVRDDEREHPASTGPPTVTR